MPSNAISVECILCRAPFTVSDILVYAYFIESGVCYNCYKKMQSLPATVSCFGKLHATKGYNPISRECKTVCPDRKACPLFATNAINRLRKAHVTQIANDLNQVALLEPDKPVEGYVPLPFRHGSVIFDAFKLCLGGVSMRAFNAFTKKRKCDKQRLLRIFRSERIYQQKWQWIEADGCYQINYPPKS